MNRARIAAIVQRHGWPSYKEKQLLDAIFKQEIADFSAVTTLSRDERAALADEDILTLSLHRLLVSSSKNAYKALLRLKSSGRLIETVLLNPKPGLWSTCISSQVGCAMACSFCATGKMGFRQNLTAEEISDQVLFWRQYLRTNQIQDERAGKPARLSNVVYMGMGEPFANSEAVFSSLSELIASDGFNLASRHIAISTSGLIPGIKKLGEEFPQVNLALSLHAATDDLRGRLMPVNKAFPLAKLAEALCTYLDLTKRKIFLEYILLKGENDNDGHARQLAAWIKKLRRPHLLHVNLIVYNQTNSGHRESERPRTFKEILADNGIQATIRKNLGRDILAACGQLLTEEEGQKASTSSA